MESLRENEHPFPVPQRASEDGQLHPALALEQAEQVWKCKQQEEASWEGRETKLCKNNPAQKLGLK